MTIKIYIHFLKINDFLDYQPIVVKTSFSSTGDLEVILKAKDIVMSKMSDGLLLRRLHWYEKLMFWKDKGGK